MTLTALKNVLKKKGFTYYEQEEGCSIVAYAKKGKIMKRLGVKDLILDRPIKEITASLTKKKSPSIC